MRFRDHARPELFDLLEPRVVLSAPPQLLGLSIANDLALSTGRPVTLTLHAIDDVGITAASFFIDVNKNNEWTEGVDRHLGEVFAPDSGTTDRYSFTFTLDAEAVALGAELIGGQTSLRFAANARDTEGRWPVTAFTRNAEFIYERPTIAFLMAEPLAGNQVRLTAQVNAPYGLPTTGMQGVTFWYDANANANSNGGWDAGIDTDLGFVTTASGPLQNRYTLIATVNPGWTAPRQFAASARDVRATPDRFGPPRVAIERDTQTTPATIGYGYIVPDEGGPFFPPIIAGQDATLTIQNLSAGVEAITVFRDVNNNGLWDFTVDQHLTAFASSGSIITSLDIPLTIDKQWGGGIVSLGVALRNTSGTGDDRWTPAFSVHFAVRFEAWVLPTAQPSYTAPASSPFTIDLTARDDVSVRSLTAFIDLDQDNRRGPGDIDLSGVAPISYRNAPSVTYRLMLTPAGLGLAPGSYRVGVYASDFALPSGPVTTFTLNVV
jgi:hypothetical protein